MSKEPVSARIEPEDIEEMKEYAETEEKSEAVREIVEEVLHQRGVPTQFFAIWYLVFFLTVEAYGTFQVERSAGPFLVALLFGMPAALWLKNRYGERAVN